MYGVRGEAGMIRPDEINKEISQELYQKYDNEYSEIRKYDAFDPYIITNFLGYMGDTGGIATLAGVAQKFIHYLKTREKTEEIKDTFTHENPHNDGKIGISRLSPKNIFLMEGIGVNRPIIEACTTMPLFSIQRGYILIVSNIKIHFNYEPRKLVYESKAPAFVPDDSCEIQRTDSCDETPELFRVKEPIWIGDPKKK